MLSMREPRDIHFNWNKVNHKVESIIITKPTSNMQTNEAAFESWSLILKSRNEIDKVEIGFEEYPLKNGHTSEFFHYNRFLYRLYKFSMQMKDWVTIAERNRNTVDRFIESMTQTSNINNCPDSNSDFSSTPKLEQILEKAFVEIPEFREKNGISFPVYDQLPNGLFKGSVSEENRIFNTGFFDLWAIDDIGDFCIYELKEPKNTDAGIISELYFYANLANSLIKKDLGCRLNQPIKKIPYRGYEILKNATPQHINAFFLVNKLHREIDNNRDQIIHLLNSNSEIKYEILYYSWNPDEKERIVEQLNSKYKMEDTV